METSQCSMCSEDFREGVLCRACDRSMHYQCAGITESGYRKLGERKNTWRCLTCRQTGQQLQAFANSPQPNSPLSTEQPTTSVLLEEIRALASKFSALESLPNEVKELRNDFKNLQEVVGVVNKCVENFGSKTKGIEDRLAQLENDKKDQTNLILARLDKIENDLKDREQWLRASNVEIKGIKESKNENLFDIVIALGSKIQYPLQKSQINFITRVPTRDPNHTKPIIVSFNNRYVKEDMIAAARAAQKESPLTPSQIGLAGNDKIYVNDHLTADNKILLNKARKLKQDKGFQYVWVKHCKIYLRKSDMSPVLHIKSEKDLIKLTN